MNSVQHSETTTVLLVEDESIYRKIIADFLRKLNMVVVQADHGEDALAILEREKIDIVVTDLAMPVMDGIILISRLRARNMKLPVIAISGTSSSGAGPTLQMADAVGATMTLDKPFQFRVLANAINRLTKSHSNR